MTEKGRVATIAMCLAALVGAREAAAQQAPSGGPRLTITVGTPPGGGYDSYGRLVARHLGAHLPGNPAIVVQNMPGAGSLIAANWLANSAPKDGTAIATLPNGTIFEALLGNRSAHFDARKINIIGSLNYYGSIGAVWHTTPFLTTRDFVTSEVLVGASAANSNNSVAPNLLNSLMGTRFRIVNGYPGSSGIDLAMERGEVQGQVGPDYDFMKATHPAWVRDKKVRLLLQVSLKRHPDLPDVPTAMELVGEKNRDVLALLIGRQTYGGMFMAPPGVPAPAIEALRQAFDRMVNDADFRRDAEKGNLALNTASAAEVEATINRLLSSAPEVIERATTELRRIDPQ